jgi:hypothetical protein
VTVTEQAQPDVAAAWNERARQLMPRVHVTWALLAVNKIVAAAMLGSGVHALEPTVDDRLRRGADHGPLTATDQWWRLLTVLALALARNLVI